MDFLDAFAIYADFLFGDKGHHFNKTMKHEIIDKAIQSNARVMGIPVFIR